MKRSSLLIQKIANDTGLSYRKAEAVMNEMLDTYVNYERLYARLGDEDGRRSWESFRLGERAILTFLDADDKMLDECLEVLVEEYDAGKESKI